MRRRHCLAGLLMLMLVLASAGCGLGGGAAAPIRVALSVPEAARVGQAVPVRLRITNTARTPTPIWFGGRLDTPSFELVVVRAALREVWRRSRHEDFMDSRVEGQLPPGEPLESVYLWEPRDNAGTLVPPGTYWLIATVPINGREIWSRPVRLRIVAGVSPKGTEAQR